MGNLFTTLGRMECGWIDQEEWDSPEIFPDGCVYPPSVWGGNAVVGEEHQFQSWICFFFWLHLWPPAQLLDNLGILIAQWFLVSVTYADWPLYIWDSFNLDRPFGKCKDPYLQNLSKEPIGPSPSWVGSRPTIRTLLYLSLCSSASLVMSNMHVTTSPTHRIT